MRLTRARVNHSPATGELIFEGKTKLFNNWVGEDLSGHAFDFRLGFRPSQVAIQSDLKILALANVLQTLVAHLFQGALDGLTLGIQNALFERNVYVGFHGDFYYTSGREAIFRVVSLS